MKIADATRSFFRRFRNRYEGARQSPGRSRVPGVVQAARFDATVADRTELVRKARYFEKNNAIVNRMADLFEQYTVGNGLQFFAASSSPAWNVEASAFWSEWKRFADLSGPLNFDSLQGIIARTLFVDGEVFIVLTKGATNRPRIQLIEGHRCATPGTMKEGEGIIDGVEIDTNGRPVAYHFLESEDQLTKKTFRRVAADFVIHIFEPSRAGQYRGIPYLHPVINDLNDLDDLQNLEMKAAKDAAAISRVIKTETGEIEDEDLLRGSVTQSDNSTRDEYYKDVFGPEVKVLKTGDEMEQFASSRPNVASQDYWDYLTAKVCAGVGIPKELVLPSSINGTMTRAVLDMANTFFRTRSAVLADHLRHVYEYVIESGIRLAPTLQPPPPDWFRSVARAPRAVNVDVGRNSAAMIAEWKSGMRTLQDIYAEVGQDWREQLTQKAEEMAFVKQLAEGLGLERAEIVQLDPNELSAANAQATLAGPDDREDDDENSTP
jgi:lambda family phage portal protein